MTPRIRRLAADHERIRNAFAGTPRIRLLSAVGDPPERYVFEFLVRGLVEESGGGLIFQDSHRAELFLPLEYPRRPPLCRMLTPVFHPNIDPQKICIGDHWSAGQALDHLVVRIAEMICYQSYNTKSPLNAAAAAWAEQNIGNLPLAAGDVAVEAVPADR